MKNHTKGPKENPGPFEAAIIVILLVLFVISCSLAKKNYDYKQNKQEIIKAYDEAIEKWQKHSLKLRMEILDKSAELYYLRRELREIKEPRPVEIDIPAKLNNA